MRYMAPLPHRDLRHTWLRYQVDGYDEGIIHSYEQRLKTIWSRPVNRVYVLDFKGLTLEMRRDLAVRIQAPLVREFILEFLSTCKMSDIELGLDVADTLCFQLGGVRRRMTWRQFILALGLHTEQEMAKAGYFLGPAPSYVLIRDHVRRVCHRMIAYSISGRGQAPKKVTDVNLFYLRCWDSELLHLVLLVIVTQYLFRHDEGRKSGARLSGGHFIGCLAMHFGLVSDEGLRGLQVAPGPERQQVAAAGAHDTDDQPDP
ncbi:hypothetical protein Tco_1273797 [Tanacetum coccineum]